MLVKRNKKSSKVVFVIVFAIIFYYMLRVMTLVSANSGNWSLDYFTIALNELYKINTPIDLSRNNILASVGVSFFILMIYETYKMQNKKNIQENTYGSAEWRTPNDIKKKRDKKFENNMILTQTELISKNMKISRMNRHVVLIGRPGSGKSRYYFKPNILSANGTIIVTDPKGELLRDCGYSLKKKGYDIKVLNLDDKTCSDCYNPLMYIKENHNAGYYDEEHPIQEDDVMSLINTIMANTKVEEIKNTSGDPFWNRAEMIYLQSLFYYVLRHYDRAHQNFTTILNLIRLSSPDSTGVSQLDKLFKEWEKEEPDAIGVKQYKHFKVAANAPKMMSTIIMTATARLASFNIKEIANMTDTDTMELNRIGMPLDDNSPLLKQINSESRKTIRNGKVAYFVITKPSNNTFNYLASIFYTQIFEVIDENAKLCGGSLATPLEIYMDEWSQLRRNTTIC